MTTTTEMTELLGGPILRRTTPNRVCVWIASVRPRAIQLRVMGADGAPLAQSSLEGLGKTDVIASAQHLKLGDSLWVYLLQARPQDGKTFPLDTLLHYSLTETDPDGETRPLDLSQLAYGGAHPSFFIPSRLKHILHGSCRKPHGGSDDGDALARAEALLAEHHGSVQGSDAKRPALLLLTGDQIYADDVAVALAAMLRDQAMQLTGIPETLPGIDLAQIPLHGRKDVLKEQDSGLSSGESENHLFSFGEYAAMYLYVFGNAQGWTPPAAWQQASTLGAADDAEDAFADQRTALQRFHGTLGKVRKLLANIPTYMMFDDHDVTDDWNITHGWYDDVRESPLGRRIVSNALAAYWAFQGWGNDPDNFDKDMVWSIQQRLTDSTNDPAIAERYDLHTWKHRGWGFSVPTLPPIIAMDSRTQRQYDDKNLPAQLLDRYALDWLRVEWAKLVTDYSVPQDTRPVLVAATPVLGFAAIEGTQTWALRFLKLIARRYSVPSWLEGRFGRWLVNKMDAESWIANRNGYKALFDALQDRMKLPGCVFLSGDVHYAFTSKGQFVCDGKTLNCLQLTSSALSNMPSERNQKLLEKLGENLPPTATHRVWRARGRKRWSTSSTLLRPHEAPKPIHAGCNVGLVQFASEVPVSHTLLTVNGDVTYRIT
jgi:hypothetical protein